MSSGAARTLVVRTRSARGGGAFGARAARGSSRAWRAPASGTHDAPPDPASAPDFPAGTGLARASTETTDIRRTALAFLGRREYGIAELRARLAAKFDDEPAIDDVLERLVAERLLDDARFVDAFIRMHRRKGHGPLRILHELAQRGVDAGLAGRMVDPRGDEWVELARSWRERRFGSTAPAGTDWQRQARHLQSRGFSTEQVRRAMRKAED